MYKIIKCSRNKILTSLNKRYNHFSPFEIYSSFFQVVFINYHYYGQFCFGVFPCMIGFGQQMYEAIDYYYFGNENTPTFRVGIFSFLIEDRLYNFMKVQKFDLFLIT